MGNVKILPEEFLDRLIEDYGLEELLFMNDVEPRTVLVLLIEEGLIDIESLYLDMELPDDDY